MKEILDKLSSYNIFNYLLPGIIFSVLASSFTNIELIHENIIIGAFIYYFIGLIISRIGSIFLEPLLEYVKFVEYESYDKFLTASEKDPKIEILLESNNMYRTFISVFVSLLILKLYLLIENIFPGLNNFRMMIALFLLLILFLFSYKKQTKYIASRIRNKSDV